MNLKQIITTIYSISDEAYNTFISQGQYVEFPKGHILSHEGTIDLYVYILTKGTIRAYSTIKNEEKTFWIGEEGCIVCSMRSYVENEKSYETIDALEDSQLFRIELHKLEQLYKNEIEIANWGRKFAEREVIKSENRLISQQFSSAKERYDDLIKNSPQLLQKVPLNIIASYLGMTQVSLSRIRAQI